MSAFGLHLHHVDKEKSVASGRARHASQLPKRRFGSLHPCKMTWKMIWKNDLETDANGGGRRPEFSADALSSSRIGFLTPSR
jgi:hypothetical protein